MAAEQLAAWLDSYRADLRSALACAAQQGYRAVQANAAGDELDPREFGDSARRHLRKYLSNLGLQLDSVAVDYAGLGLADPTRANQRVDRLRQTLELCADLGVRRAGVRLGGFEDAATAPLAGELLGVVADLANRYGIAAAVHSPDSTPDASAARIRVLACPQLRMALDTAWPLTTPGGIAGVADLVEVAYLRDVRRSGDQYEEVPFGTGDVDLAGLLAGLAGGACDAALVVRHDAEGGVDALRQGREYMRSLIGRFGPR